MTDQRIEDQLKTNWMTEDQSVENKKVLDLLLRNPVQEEQWIEW